MVTLPKFNSSPLKSYLNPIGKKVFQPSFFRGELLNFGGVFQLFFLKTLFLSCDHHPFFTILVFICCYHDFDECIIILGGGFNTFENYVHTKKSLKPSPRIYIYIYAYIYMGVSKNRGTPKSSILIGLSIVNHPF